MRLCSSRSRRTAQSRSFSALSWHPRPRNSSLCAVKGGGVVLRSSEQTNGQGEALPVAHSVLWKHQPFLSVSQQDSDSRCGRRTLVLAVEGHLNMAHVGSICFHPLSICAVEPNSKLSPAYYRTQCPIHSERVRCIRAAPSMHSSKWSRLRSALSML